MHLRSQAGARCPPVPLPLGAPQESILGAPGAPFFSCRAFRNATVAAEVRWVRLRHLSKNRALTAQRAREPARPWFGGRIGVLLTREMQPRCAPLSGEQPCVFLFIRSLARRHCSPLSKTGEIRAVGEKRAVPLPLGAPQESILEAPGALFWSWRPHPALLRAHGIAIPIRPGFPAIPVFVARHAELGPAISLIDSSLVPHTWIGVGKQQAHVRQPRAHKFT